MLLGVTDNGFIPIVQQCGNTLSVINIRGCWGVKRGFAAISFFCGAALRSLDLSFCPFLDGEALISIATSQNIRLRVIKCEGCKLLTEESLFKLIVHQTLLEEISLNGINNNNNINNNDNDVGSIRFDEVMICIGEHLRHIQKLDFSNNDYNNNTNHNNRIAHSYGNVTDVGIIEGLSQCSATLRNLSLRNCSTLTKKAITALSSFLNLTFVDVCGCAHEVMKAAEQEAERKKGFIVSSI